VTENKYIGLSILLFSLLLSGCSSLDTAGELITGVSSYFLGGEDNSTPPAELVKFTPEINIDVVWSENIGVGADGQFLNLGLSISDGKVFVADHQGLVQARKPESGHLIWKTETEFNYSAGPAIGDQTIVLATSNAEVVALDAETGQQRWITPVSSEVLATPVIADHIVIIRTTDGKVFALDEKEGHLLWVFERSVPALTIRGTGSPIIVENNLIAGFANGKLLALRLTDGKVVWETTIAIPSGRSEVERLVDLDVDPVETDGVIYLSSFQTGTSAVLEIDGDVLWRNEDISSFSGLSFDWRYLYITDTESHIWQLDQRNGAALWKQGELHHRNLTAPVVYEDYVVVGDYAGYVHWLSTNDGRQLGRINITDSPIVTKPVVINNKVFLYAKDGTLSALKIVK